MADNSQPEMAKEVTPSLESSYNHTDEVGEEAMRTESTPYDLSPSKTIVQSTLSLLNESDLQTVLDNQRSMLERFEKTNEMLRTVLQLSAHRYDEINNEFRAHTQALTTMKRDLDTIFRRIRSLKVVVAKQLPQEFATASVSHIRIEEEESEAPEDTFSLSALPVDSARGPQPETRGRAKSQS